MDNKYNEYLPEIKKNLSQRIGIDLNTLTGLDFSKIIAKKLQTLNIKEVDKYYFQLLNNQQTFDELIEEIVIPETSFFRHPSSFEYLRTYAFRENTEKKHFRILSIPCSTGEETYSIAITLLESGISPSKITIDGLDISKDAIHKAQMGHYKKYAFRSNEDLFEQYHLLKYFDFDQEMYTVKSEVKSLINFQQGNLVNPLFLVNNSYYDIIFCRNVLIYFSEAARQTALLKLYKSLIDEGLLFIGYAETNFINKNHFKSLSIAHAFVYQKQKYKSFLDDRNSQFSSIVSNNDLASADRPYKVGESNFTAKSNLNKKVNQSTTVSKSLIKVETVTPKGSSFNTFDQNIQTIENVRLIADQGNLDLALNQCQLFLKNNPTKSDGYLLLGEIYQAKNLDLEARQAFEKALYLNPDCIESITHLIFLCEQSKDFKRANIYRQRLRSKESDFNG